MSSHDHDESSELEQMLLVSEREEALALRQELETFLRSPACRDELKRVLRDPLKDLVAETLRSEAFVSEIGREILAALRPAVLTAAKEAVKHAVKEVAGTTAPQWRDEVQQQALDQLKAAFEKEQRAALSEQGFVADVNRSIRSKVEAVVRQAVSDGLNTLPRDWAEPLAARIRTQVQQAADTTAASLAASSSEGSQRGRFKAAQPWHRGFWKRISFWAYSLVVVVVVVIGIFALVRSKFFFPEETDRGQDTVISQTATTHTNTRVDKAAQPENNSQEPPLFKSYLALAASPQMPPAESKCIEQAIAAASRDGQTDSRQMSAGLAGCPVLQVAPSPTTSSFVVAALQARLSALQDCQQKMTVDGLPGPGTNRRVAAYFKCKKVNKKAPSVAADYVEITLRSLLEDSPQ